MVTDPTRRMRGRRVASWATVLLLTAAARPASAQVMDSSVHWFALLDQLELAPNRGGTPLKADATGWLGGDVNRLWVRAEADQETESASGELQGEAFYGRLFSPYWDALVGIRVDHQWGDETATRAHVALGLEGLAPYWFEVEPTLYVSQDGDVSAQLEAEYELLLTNRLILQPLAELEIYGKSDPARRLGAGLGSLETGS